MLRQEKAVRSFQSQNSIAQSHKIILFYFLTFSLQVYWRASVIEGFARFSVCFKAFLVMLHYTELCLLYEYWNRMGS